MFSLEEKYLVGIFQLEPEVSQLKQCEKDNTDQLRILFR